MLLRALFLCANMSKTILSLVCPLRVFAVGFLLSCGSEAGLAADAPATRIPIAVIGVPSSQGQDVGTCCLLAKTTRTAYWITAWHVIKDNHRATFTISRPNRGPLSGAFVAGSADSDLAIIRTTAAGVDEHGVPVWPYKLRGRECYAVGYAEGSFEKFGRRRGQYELRLSSPAQSRWTFPSLPGDSGGPLFTVWRNRPYIVGVCSSSDYWLDNFNRAHPGTVTSGGDSGDIRALCAKANLPIGPSGYVGLPVAASEAVECQYTLGGRCWPNPLRRRPQQVQVVPQPNPG